MAVRRENSSVQQITRLGVEAADAPGTLVPASRILRSLGMDIDPKVPSEIVHPMGGKFATDLTYGKEYVEGTLKGSMAYNDLTYVFGSLLGRGVSAGNVWTFSPNQDDVDDPLTFSFEYGSSVNACRFAYGIVSDFDMSLSKTKADMTAKLFGRKIDDGITLTSDPTSIPLVSINPKSFALYVSPDDATFTKLDRCLDFKWSVKNRYAPLFTIDSTEESFVNHVEMSTESTVNLTVEKDSTADGIMEDLRGSELRYARLISTGPTIGGNPHSLDIRFPFKYREPKRGQTDNVETASFDLFALFDAGFNGGAGGALRVTLSNGITTL